jgi:hypothetical protein
LVIGNKNAMTYKEVFPLIKENRLWIGPTILSGDREFMVTKDYITHSPSLRIDENGNKYIRVPGVHWFTNLEHGRRHEPLRLMSMKDNMRYGKHKDICENGYQKYVNFDGIDIPYSDAIPDDYYGAMGVPLTFLDRYCPEQFEIIGLGIGDLAKELGISKNHRGRTDLEIIDPKSGKAKVPYSRILIRKRQ